MNEIEKITEKIEEEAKKSEREALESARMEVERTLAEYEARAEAIREVAAERIKNNAEASRVRADSAAKFIVRNMTLQMKNELIDHVYHAAGERIRGQKDADYSAFLSDVAVFAAEEGVGEMIFNRADSARIGRRTVEDANRAAKAGNLNSSFILSERNLPISGGFVLKYADREVNCSIDALVASVRPETESRVVEKLFPHG